MLGTEESYEEIIEMVKFATHRRAISALKYGVVPFIGHELDAPSDEGTKLVNEYLNLHQRMSKHIEGCKSDKCVLKDDKEEKENKEIVETV